ncbi:hypothetical protein [Flavobacterium sp. CAU 1735]|uniref:hypothetical protein n=1 Tax=Flavobacterium sp. CAU 1735 TaxID=3140361 RepID=UPI003261BD28
MNLFRFFQKKKAGPIQDYRIDAIAVKNQGDKHWIELNEQMNMETIQLLLKTLRTHKIPFSVFDEMIYSWDDDHDRGAYITYSQDQNDKENSWSMTLGNQGWSGGIYTITEQNIALQLWHLVQEKSIDSITIKNVAFFGHYDKEDLDSNQYMNTLLYSTHANLTYIRPDYLIFGIFKSGDYLGSYTIYKVTDTQLWADTREVWHSERFKPEGYVFKGEELPLDKWNKAKELINTVPQELLTDDWDSFYSTGNKNEDKLVLAFGNPEFQKTITIDTYGIATEKLPIAVGNYRRAVEKLVKEL